MFGKIAGFEFRYQLRQPIFWVGVVIFGLLSFGSVASSNVHIGSTDNVHKNAAFVIGQTTLIMVIIYMFVTAAFVANVVVRDDETAYGPIIRSTPLRKVRLSLWPVREAAFAAAALAFLAVPFGLWLGSVAPWVDPETLSPFAIQPYLYAYFVLALPFLFLSAVLFFALTTVTRSMMWTYVGVIALMVFRAVFGIVTAKPGLEHVAALWDPFGLSAFLVATHYWTASERNTLLPAIQGDFLWNKLIWLGIAAAILAATYRLFNFQSAETSGRSRKRAALTEPAATAETPAPLAGGQAKPQFGRQTTWAQLVARTRLDAAQVFFSPAYFVLLGLGGANAVVSLWLATDVSTYGGRIYPVSRVMILALNGAFTAFSLIIAIYYAGELVWREREKRTHEIIDATPIADWIFIAPKTIAIALVLISTSLISVVVAVLLQAIKGYFGFEIGKYLLWYVLPGAIDFTLAVLAIFVQALSPHKFIGWAVMALYMVSTLVLGNLGFENNLYQYANSPDVPLSDMNGQGHFWIGAYWFRLYWSAFAAVLLVLAYGLWRRGTEARFMPRLHRLPYRLRGGAGVILAGALVVFAGTGAFIYLNTHVWNEYRTKLGDERWTADYEKAFLRYETLPQPKVARSVLDVQLYPHETRASVRGSYLIQNRTSGPIGVLHLRFDRDVKVDASLADRRRIASLKTGLDIRGSTTASTASTRPCSRVKTRTLTFAIRRARAEAGFKNSGNSSSTSWTTGPSSATAWA